MGDLNVVKNWVMSLVLMGTFAFAGTQPRYASIDEAIARGDLEDVKAHLAANPETANQGKHPKMPPLHQAILRKKSAIALALIEAGADVNATDSAKRSPLHLAAQRKNANIAKVLLQKAAHPNVRDRVGWTPLHHAGAKDAIAVAKVLIDGGADPMTLSKQGGTPLHEAAASGSARIATLFLDAGIDPNVVSKTGATAASIAIKRENNAVLEILKRPPQQDM